MDVIVRQATASDHEQILSIVERAFTDVGYSDQTEHLLVDRLHESPKFIAKLSLVAELDGGLIGYVLLTPVSIRNIDRTVPSLALAPVAVLPQFQGKGVGGQLIQAAHMQAMRQGYNSVIVLGHPDYYPRFGYQPAHRFGISLPFKVSRDYCMVIELARGALRDVHGVVEYPDAFHG